MIRWSANAVHIGGRHRGITIWRRWRQKGWDFEHQKFMGSPGTGWIQVSWGRPMIHSRFAFMVLITYR